MRRGDIWVSSRFGRDLKVLVVGNEGLTAVRPAVLVLPISDVMSPGMVEPVVADDEGTFLGVAQVPRVGEMNKMSLTSRAGALAPASVEIVDMALRAALDL